MKLFREEAIAHQQQKLYGSIFLATPLRVTVLVLLFVAIVALVIAFLFMGGMTRKETLQGILVPESGLIGVFPSQVGLVIEKRVAEGQVVHAGDILFVLSGERSSLNGDTQQVVVSALKGRIARLRDELVGQAQQTRQQSIALQRRVTELHGQIDQIDSEIALQRQRVELASASAKRYGELSHSGFVSEAQVRDRTAEGLDQQERLHSLERSRAALRADLSTLEADRDDLPLRAAREASALERNIAEIQQELAENEARREIVVHAPQDGTVTAIAAERGQYVPLNWRLASVLPAHGVLEAELYVPARAIGFIHAGSMVKLRYSAFPYQKFGVQGGVVREISRTALAPDDIVLAPAREGRSAEAVYRVRVRLNSQTVQVYDHAEPLRSGMQVDASVLLEHRRLYEWIFEPVFGIVGRQ